MKTKIEELKRRLKYACNCWGDCDHTEQDPVHGGRYYKQEILTAIQSRKGEA